MCVQIRADWDLSAHMPLTDIGWGIIYPLVVHDEHPDIKAYDKAVSISDIVMGDQKDPVDPAEQERKKRQLAHVKREEEEAEPGDGREPNPGIRKHTKGMQGNESDAHKAKKQRTTG